MTKKRVEKMTEPTERKQLSPSLEKTKMINALSSACSNPELLTALEKMECGDLLLEIFAKAINKKIEQLFVDNSGKDDIVESGIERVVGKLGVIEKSPVLALLERLYTNMVQAQQAQGMQPQVPQQRPAPQHPQTMPEMNQMGSGNRMRGEGLGF